MAKDKLLIYLHDTIDVCEFLIEQLGYIPEGSSVLEHINETKQIIGDMNEQK